MVPPTAPLLRAAAVRSAVVQNARMAPKYAGQRQASGHAVDAGPAVQYPSEGFSGPFWRNTVLALIVSAAAYRFSISYAPAAKPIDLSDDHHPEAIPVEAKDESMPYLTKYLAYHMPRQGMWKEHSEKHLELTVKQAEDQLLLQDAQRPKIRRFRYSGTFEQASPHGISPGEPIDMSDLKVRANFNAPVGESEE